MKSLNLTLIFIALTWMAPAHAIEISFENDPSLPVVNINVVIKGGAALDPQAESGLTNFMAEMLLRGTKSKTKEQIDSELDQLGARLEIETRLESVILRGSVLSKELGPFLNLITEVLTQPNFSDKEIAKLKSKIGSDILEELGNDRLLAGRRFMPFLFRGHPYGKPLNGIIKSVKNFTRGQLFAHYDKLVRDRHLLVIGSGDASESKIKNWTYSLAEMRQGGEELLNVEAPEDVKIKRLLLIDKPDRTQTQIVGGQIGVKMTDPRFFALYVANHAFGGSSFQARLMQEIRVKRGWSYGAYSYFKNARQPRTWQWYLFPASKDTAQALKQVFFMLREFKKLGINSEEFNFARDSLINGSGFMYNTSKKRVENKLVERTLDLPNEFTKSYAHEIGKLTQADINHAVAEYIKPEQMTIAVVGTAKLLKEKLAQAIDIPVEQVQVVPYGEE